MPGEEARGAPLGVGGCRAAVPGRAAGAGGVGPGGRPRSRCVTEGLSAAVLFFPGMRGMAAWPTRAHTGPIHGAATAGTPAPARPPHPAGRRGPQTRGEGACGDSWAQGRLRGGGGVHRQTCSAQVDGQAHVSAPGQRGRIQPTGPMTEVPPGRQTPPSPSSPLPPAAPPAPGCNPQALRAGPHPRGEPGARLGVRLAAPLPRAGAGY